MNSAASPPDNACFAVAPPIRVARDDDGLVLLDTQSCTYLSLDPIGALIWQQIEAGASTLAIIEHVEGACEGAHRARVDADVRDLLARCAREGWITPAEPLPSWSSPPPASMLSAPTRALDRQGGSVEAGWRCTLAALAQLVWVDLLMRFSQDRGVYDAVRRAALRARRAGPGKVAQLCRAMERAASLYVKRAWCLQRSAAWVRLLRRHGAPAELVLGVRTFPFAAHAWVELDGYVVGDSFDKVRQYLVIDRL